MARRAMMRMRAAARRAGSRRASGWAVADVEAPQRSLPRETGGFTAVRQEEVSELGGIATLYRHDRTGAELLAVHNSDPNKVFSITLRTAPEDSTGVAHILEHCTLGGSINYPLKETIVELIKTSNAEFINAMTAPDRTMYPVASTNSQDLLNLARVYIDAVFNPLAVRSERGREIFRQEGHRLELDDPDSSSPTLTGVVYQEMKGNYSSADTVASRTAARCLFDNGKSTYAVESGGHPEDIPALTYESFIDFHNRKYHPSNCRFFVYGDDAQTLQQSMDLVNNAIQDFEPRSVEDTMVKAQPLWTEGKFIQEPYPASEDETKRYVYVNWLLQEQPLQDDKRLIWEMLNHLLLGTSAAPLRKALEESGYGDRVMGDGLEDELYQPFFSIGLKGVEAENVREVEQLIYSTLERVANEGFSRKSMEASQHAIEFALRENNTGRIPQGMAAMMASLTNWIYDRDPLAPLRWEQPLADLKERLFEHDEDPFTPMIKEGLLSNNHTVTLEMYPDPNFGGNIEQREESYVEDATSSMSRDDAEKLVQETQELRRRQQEPDDPETRNLIPTLNIDDLPKTPKSVPTNVDQQDGYELVTHPIFTRGLAYADVLLDLHAVPSRLLPLVPTFCNALTEVGSQDMSPDDLQMRINSKTGGVSFSPTVSSVKYSNDPAAYIACRGKAVTDRSSDMFSILHDILHGAQLDNRNKVKQLVLESKSAMEQRVISAGHTIAASRIGAMNTLAGFVNEQMNGVSQLQFLRELAERIDSDWDGVRDDLEEIRRTLLNKANGKVNITAGEDDLSTVVRSANGFMETIQNNPSNGSDWMSISMLPKKNEALVVPTTVNYVGKGALLYDFGYQHHGASTAINKAISMSYLWDQVRASGGAYGVFGSFNAQSGMETMVSFRDPNFARTLDVYDGASNYLRTSELSDDEVTRSVIGAIGDLDKHELPDAMGYSALMRHVMGITDEERQARREELLSTTAKEFKEFAEYMQSFSDKGQIVAVSSESDAQSVQESKPEVKLEMNNVV